MRKILILILCAAFSTGLWAQGTQVQFGKNRVQYNRDFDEWSQYESRNFITYWYGEARFIGQAVVQLAEYDFETIQNLLEHRINDKIEIIVYTDLTDLKQSNIGVEEAFVNAGGLTKIVDNKMFVYFDGNYMHLRRQIREGIASVYLNAILFGSNLQEIVQNAVMMNLPEWFKQGLIAYAGEYWNTAVDEELHDVLSMKKFKNFEAFAEEYPQLAGHSFWYYISQTYGRSTVSNLLYLTRINRSVESGFLYVLGATFDQVIEGWTAFFDQRMKQDLEGQPVFPEEQKVPVKNKRKLPLTQLSLSPDGQKLVYVLNDIGKYKVYLHDFTTGKREIIFKYGFRNAFQATDYNYPLVSWNPSGFELAILYEHRDVAKLALYDLNTKKFATEDLSPQYQRVYSMDFMNNNSLVFSATVRGYVDLYLYFTNTRQSERLTNDYYSDLDPVSVRLNNHRGILFASNRTDTLLTPQGLDTILPLNTYDLFYLDLDSSRQELVRVTRTPLANERQPMGIDTTYFSYLSDYSGIYNRQVGYLEDYIAFYQQVINLKDGDQIVLHADSTLSGLDSTQIDSIYIRPVIKKKAVTYNNDNAPRSLVFQDAARRSNRVVEMLVQDQTPVVYIRPLNVNNQVPARWTQFQRSAAEYMARSGSASPGELLPHQGMPADQPIVPQNLEPVPDEEPEIIIPLLPPQRDTVAMYGKEYLFQSRFSDEPENDQPVLQDPVNPQNPSQPDFLKPAFALPSLQLKQEVERFRPARIVPYRLKFRTDFFTTQLDNSLLFGGLDSYVGNPDRFGYPPPGLLFKGNFKDLLEDYQIEGGVRFPTTFNGSEYFMVFDDRKKRLDKRIALYRRNWRYANELRPNIDSRTETTTLLGQYEVRYPLDIFRSVRATGTLRQDRRTELAVNATTLEIPTYREQRMSMRLEYVFDNTMDIGINFKNGTRYKVYGEVVKRFNLNLINGFNFDFNKGVMGLIGLDARHYQRLDRLSIFAARIAGAASFGSERILYYLGGVDNWLFPSFEEGIPYPQGGNFDFAYQTAATNLRGFGTNIRNGSNFAVVNAELRVPLFRYLNRRTQSSFFRNFHLVGFFDAGTAWQGWNPYAEDNPLNIIDEANGPYVRVKVNYFRDPIVAGYGIGARTLLFGYLLRVDYAWGIETRLVQKPKLYISLGMDF